MANAKTISYIDAVNKQARELLRAEMRVMLEPVREVIGILDRRTNDLNERLKKLEQAMVDEAGKDTERAFDKAAREGGVPTPQKPDAA